MRTTVADWYYIGHYGQLGPLTLDQLEELVENGVIVPETYVWATGMSQWQAASSIPELSRRMTLAPVVAPPPPPQIQAQHPPMPFNAQQPYGGQQQYGAQQPYGSNAFLASPNPMTLSGQPLMSDRSRVAGGVLNIVLPGVGRMYLGYAAIGVLQLVVTICTGGVGVLWPLVDGILILSGTVKHDGYGRTLKE